VSVGFFFIRHGGKRDYRGLIYGISIMVYFLRFLQHLCFIDPASDLIWWSYSLGLRFLDCLSWGKTAFLSVELISFKKPWQRKKSLLKRIFFCFSLILYNLNISIKISLKFESFSLNLKVFNEF
jgi:hypothetical protein